MPQGHIAGSWATCSLPGSTGPEVQSCFPASWPLLGGSHSVSPFPNPLSRDAADPSLSAAEAEGHEAAGLREDPATLSLFTLRLCRLLASSCCESFRVITASFPAAAAAAALWCSSKGSQESPDSLRRSSQKTDRISRHSQKPLPGLWCLPAVLCCAVGLCRTAGKQLLLCNVLEGKKRKKNMSVKEN